MFREPNLFFPTNIYEAPDPLLEVPAATAVRGNMANGRRMVDDDDVLGDELSGRGLQLQATRASTTGPATSSTVASSRSSSVSSGGINGVNGALFVQTSTRLIGASVQSLVFAREGEPDDGESAFTAATTPPNEIAAGGSTTNEEVFTTEPGRHVVRPTDTLQGLALQYSVTVEEIRRANNLWPGDSIHFKPILLIPRSKAASVSRSDKGRLGGQETHAPIEGYGPPGIRRSASEPDNTLPRSTGTSVSDLQKFLKKVDANVSTAKASIDERERQREHDVGSSSVRPSPNSRPSSVPAYVSEGGMTGACLVLEPSGAPQKTAVAIKQLAREQNERSIPMVILL